MIRVTIKIEDSKGEREITREVRSVEAAQEIRWGRQNLAEPGATVTVTW